MPPPDVLNRFAVEHTPIQCVQFGVLKPSEVRGLSVCEIDKDKTWDKGEARVGGVYDPRLGPCTRKLICPTCNGDMNTCRGHFGHIELAAPVFVPSFIATVHRVLKCVCFHCSTPLLLPESIDVGPRSRPLKYSGPERLAELAKVCPQMRVCRLPGEEGAPLRHPGCGMEQPTFVRHQGRIQIIYPGEDPKACVATKEPPKDHNLFEEAWRMRQVLERITDAHAQFLGLNPKISRPEWMMAIVWPVPPPCIRPLHTTPAHNRGDDDITAKLKQIVQTNRHLRECTAPDVQTNRRITPAKASENWYLLQWHINTLVDNRGTEYASATHRKNNKPLKTFGERIKGKKGRVREDVQGKRVDGAGRTVLAPGTHMAFDEVGIGETEAKELCITEFVTPLNRDRLEALVRTGPDVWPGANYVIIIDPATKRVSKEICLERHSHREDLRLELGWAVTPPHPTPCVFFFSFFLLTRSPPGQTPSHKRRRGGRQPPTLPPPQLNDGLPRPNPPRRNRHTHHTSSHATTQR